MGTTKLLYFQKVRGVSFDFTMKFDLEKLFKLIVREVKGYDLQKENRSNTR